MPGNSFGQIFRITTFGESHGEMIGAVIDGCPAGLEIDLDFIQHQLDKRRPGQSKITTQRKESDAAHFISGIFEGKTTGTPVAFFIKNEDQREQDYDHLSDKFRPSHADFTYEKKYGHRDHRGGGRSSARETAARVAAGAVAQLLLKHAGIKISAYVSQVGSVKLQKSYAELNMSLIESNPVRCPDAEIAKKMISIIESVKRDGDTVGGVITCVVSNCPIGLGEPVFDRLHADLAKACMSINAAKGFEYGSGFEGVSLKGSEHNDLFIPARVTSGSRLKNQDKNQDKDKDKDENQSEHENRNQNRSQNQRLTKNQSRTEATNPTTVTNNSGGIQGGISNGMDIYFRVAFKPVATILKAQDTINMQGEKTTLIGKGRHDPCVVPRAVPIVEAMAAFVIADHFLRNKAARLKS